MPKIGKGLYRQKTRVERKCGKCGAIIAKGEDYIGYWGYYRAPLIRCNKHECFPRASEMTSSDKLSTLYSASESIQDVLRSFSSLEDIAQALEDAARDAETTAEEYEESASNMEEYFPGSAQVDEIREKSEACEAWQQELESAKDEVESLQSEVEELQGRLDEGEVENEEESDKLKGEIEAKKQEAVDKAGEASSSLEI